MNTFHPTLASSGTDLVVCDFYTTWCGPCKLMMPKLVLMASRLQTEGVRFYKVNCNADFKPIGKTLGIKVAPTFHLYREGKLLATMTGAKEVELEALVEAHLVPAAA